MAFKMKGSPIKLGNIATKSALKGRYTITHKDDEKMANKMRAHNEKHSGDMVHDDGDPETWWNVNDERPRKAQMDTKYKNPDGSPKLDDQGNPLVDPAPTKMKSALKATDPNEAKMKPKSKSRDFRMEALSPKERAREEDKLKDVWEHRPDPWRSSPELTSLEKRRDIERRKKMDKAMEETAETKGLQMKSPLEQEARDRASDIASEEEVNEVWGHRKDRRDYLEGLSRKEINKMLKDYENFDMGEQGTYRRALDPDEEGNPRYSKKIDIPGKWASKDRKIKYLLTQGKKRRSEMQPEAMSRENYNAYLDAGIDPTTMEPIEEGKGVHGQGDTTPDHLYPSDMSTVDYEYSSSKEERPDPTYEGTDEFRPESEISEEEIRQRTQ